MNTPDLNAVVPGLAGQDVHFTPAIKVYDQGINYNPFRARIFTWEDTLPKLRAQLCAMLSRCGGSVRLKRTVSSRYEYRW